MKFLPVIPVKIEEQQQRKLFIDLVQCLAGVLESTTYTVEVTWNAPLTMYIPISTNVPRLLSPEFIRLGRAQAMDDLDTPVHFGAVAFKWLGNSQVQLQDVDGLVAGQRYRLVFEVVG